MASIQKHLLTLILFVLVLGTAGPSLPGENLKIGVIVSDRLIEETVLGRQAKENFMAELEETRQVLLQKQKRIKILRDSLILSQQIDDEKSSIEKQKEKLSTEIREYQQIEKLLERRLNQIDLAIADKLREKVQGIINEIFIREQGYDIILEKQDTAAFSEKVDITGEIITVLNREAATDEAETAGKEKKKE